MLDEMEDLGCVAWIPAQISGWYFVVLHKYTEFRGHATRRSEPGELIDFPSILETSTFERERSLPLTVTPTWACDTHQLGTHGLHHKLPVSIGASRAPAGGTFRKCRFRAATLEAILAGK